MFDNYFSKSGFHGDGRRVRRAVQYGPGIINRRSTGIKLRRGIHGAIGRMQGNVVRGRYGYFQGDIRSVADYEEVARHIGGIQHHLSIFGVDGTIGPNAIQLDVGAFGLNVYFPAQLAAIYIAVLAVDVHIATEAHQLETAKLQ